MCNLPPEIRAALYGIPEDADVPDESADDCAEDLDSWETV
ncbi:hypothetical protein GCM10009630_31840 [Kribbella jejuensis]|uniref:Uncharacterized protein n=1 Tax=Kribbella jejuensis TaxID=236068 RepID=A0A542DTR9_9ACTN|nr:hypothetical protein FB475_6129 [Kribbella jejuensis]